MREAVFPTLLRGRAAALGVALMAATVACARSEPDPGARIPATPAGARLGEWLQAFNSGDPAAIVRFARSSWSDSALREMPAEERAAWDAMIHADHHTLVPREITQAGAHEVLARVQSGLTGMPLAIRVRVEREPPHAVSDLRIRFSQAPPERSRSRLDDAAIVAEVESFLDRLVAADAFSGVVLVAHEGRPLLIRADGMADRDAGVPIRPGTRFNLGSMNKMFTAVAIAQLAQAGKLRLTDPVGVHLPDFPNRAVAARVTIHHLLTHTAGLGMYWNARYEAVKDRIRTISEFLALVEDESPAFEPGSRFQYSNNGYVVLGAIVERVSGEDYYDYLGDHVFGPAGMTQTGSLEQGAAIPDLAVGYTFLDARGRARLGGRRSNAPLLGRRGSSAGGGYSTAADLMRFAEALRRNTLLDSAHTALLLEGKVSADEGRYAYGFEATRVNGRHIVGHGGGFPGVATHLDILPDLGYSVVVLSNYEGAAAFAVSHLLRELLTADPAPGASPPSPTLATDEAR